MKNIITSLIWLTFSTRSNLPISDLKIILPQIRQKFLDNKIDYSDLDYKMREVFSLYLDYFDFLDND